jgi:RNA polymerase sigma-70 factor (ECF subfamily)
VAALPDEHRAVLELRFFAGASLDEIAALLGCPLGTVKSRLHHGLEKLRRARISVNLFAGSGESPVSDT